MKLVTLGNSNYQVRKSLVDELFNSFLYNDYHAGHCNNQPATNVSETDKDFRLELLLPGFSKEDVNLNYQKKVLTVKAGTKKEEGSEVSEDKYLRREFGVSDFEKQINVPESVDIEKINAKFENGILEVILPKKEEAVEKSPFEISVL
jgi:HSP20 family protein